MGCKENSQLPPHLCDSYGAVVQLGVVRLDHHQLLGLGAHWARIGDIRLHQNVSIWDKYSYIWDKYSLVWDKYSLVWHKYIFGKDNVVFGTNIVVF